MLLSVCPLIWNPVGSKSNRFQFPASFHTPKPAASCWRQQQPGGAPPQSCESCPMDSSLRCLRDQQAIPSEVWVLDLQTPRSGKLILFPRIPGPRSGSCFLSYSLCDHSASFSLFSLSPLEPISSIKFSAKITRMVYLLLGP